MRLIHRYLGYFLAGIMAVYAITGVILIFRDQDGFKKEVEYSRTIAAGLSEKEVGKILKIKNFEATEIKDELMLFKQGSYHLATGAANYTMMEYPYVIDKMVGLHKAKSAERLSVLNVFFGVSLLIYVVSSFFMFLPKNPVFKRGMWFVLTGLVLGFTLLFI